jgi:hypothetical protein
MMHRILDFAAASIVMCVLSPLMIQSSKAEANNESLFSPSSNPFGLSFTEWSIKWWKWLIGIPQSQNPLDDDTGRKCAISQTDPNVWYLTGANSGNVVRNCTVPVGRAIAINIAGNECSFAEYPALKTESQLKECAISGDKVNTIYASIDGKNLQDISRYIVLTPLFKVTFPSNNIFTAQPGPTQAVSHSYFLFLKPFTPGKHTIHFAVVYLGNAAQGGSGANSYDVKYNIEVPNQ